MVRITFKEKADGIHYKTYSDKKNVSRQIKFGRDIAEEINKIKQVVRLEADIQISSSVIVDVALRYFFEYLEQQDEETALNIVLDGAFLKLD